MAHFPKKLARFLQKVAHLWRILGSKLALFKNFIWRHCRLRAIAAGKRRKRYSQAKKGVGTDRRASKQFPKALDKK